MATDTVFIYTMNRGVQGGAWSRYVFPFTIEHFTHLENTLYMRHEDTVSFAIEGSVDDDGEGYLGVIQWPWLDFENPSVNKMLQGFDIVGTGVCDIQFGYDQTNLASFTAAYTIPADTYPGDIIPFNLVAPSMSVKLTYAADQDWQWNALSLYLRSNRVATT